MFGYVSTSMAWNSEVRSGTASRPLPAERYILAQWKKVRPNIDYHVEFERHYYSVSYQLVGLELEAQYTAATVEIFY
jgi:hypothetical protein